MTTGRVASRATSNDFYDLDLEREMMIYETRPNPNSQPQELDQPDRLA